MILSILFLIVVFLLIFRCLCFLFLFFPVRFLTLLFFVFFKHKTAYDMRISYWISDVCSSDLGAAEGDAALSSGRRDRRPNAAAAAADGVCANGRMGERGVRAFARAGGGRASAQERHSHIKTSLYVLRAPDPLVMDGAPNSFYTRSEEHTSELQSLMRISYAVFCLKKKKQDISIKIYT